MRAVLDRVTQVTLKNTHLYMEKKIFTNAAFAICGMVKFESVEEKINKPLIAATMFGVTTPCVDKPLKKVIIINREC